MSCLIRRLLYPCIHDFVVLRGILSRHYINYNISCPLLTLDLFNGVSEPWSVSWKSWIWYKKQLKTLTFVTSSNTLSYQQKVIIQTPSFRKLTTVVIGDVSCAPFGWFVLPNIWWFCCVCVFALYLDVMIVSIYIFSGLFPLIKWHTYLNYE